MNLKEIQYPIIILIAVLVLSACSVLTEIPKHGAGFPTQKSAINLHISPSSIIVSSPQSLIDNSSSVQPSHTTSTPDPPFDATSMPTSYPLISPTPLPVDYWMSLPILPTVSKNAREIYYHGIEMGRDPHAFSKIGDCQSITTYFLKNFDQPDFYNLGDYNTLQETIDWFSGSFSRDSLSVKGGLNAAAILSPLRADPKVCDSNENPIACEFRLHNPSIAIISLEEWWLNHPEKYESYMRQIIEYSIQNGVLPILATKADNLEGNHVINQIIARLSLEYDIPLWNFWHAVQPLQNHGLIKVDPSGKVDMFHLTRRVGYYFFNNPIARRSGWAVRNLTALQVLDAVRRGLVDQP